MISQRIRRRIENQISRYILSVDGDRLCARMNRLGRFVGFRPEVHWDSIDQSYIVSEAGHQVWVPRKKRLKWFRDGISSRLSSLRNSYLLDEIEISDGDVIIDIGANIGELSLVLSLGKSLNVVAAEPESLEAFALRKNLSTCHLEVIERPLWKSTAEVDWYSANDSGDSSVFQPKIRSESRRRMAVSLDEVAEKSRILRGGAAVKLLKLEAEGAEPEILEGATELLKRVQYITADVGAERGLRKENTLIEVLNILHRAGFEAIKFGLPRPVMLFNKVASES